MNHPLDAEIKGRRPIRGACFDDIAKRRRPTKEVVLDHGSFLEAAANGAECEKILERHAEGGLFDQIGDLYGNVR